MDTRLLLAFFLGEDAIHVAGVGIDLALVLDFDVLRAVFLVADFKKLPVHLARVAFLDKMLPGLEAERQADQRDWLAVDLRDQHRFVAKLVAVFVARVQLDDSDSTRNQ